MLKKEVKTKKSCGFKAGELCMFAGTEQGDKQAFESVQEELNLKAIQINDEKMKTKESNQNVGPADDCSRVVEGIKGYVKFPSSTPKEVVELYRKLYRERRELERQMTYVQLVNENQHTDVLTKKVEETSEPEKKVVDEIAGDEPKHVVEGHEAWEVATSMAAVAATSMVTAETTFIAAEEALMPYDVYSNNCFVSTSLNEDAGKNMLDKEIELRRQMMMKESRKRPATVKQRRSNKF